MAAPVCAKPPAPLSPDTTSIRSRNGAIGCRIGVSSNAGPPSFGVHAAM